MPTINDWFTEGQHLQDAHRFADAECLYRRVLDVDSNHLDAWHNLAVVCAMQDKLADADEVTRHGLAAFPDNVDLLTQRGITLARQNRLPDAIATFRRAIELKPDHAKAHNNLGVALAQLGRRDEALECHCEAARVQPDYAEAHFNMAVVLSERRLNSDAIAAYERALQVRPDFLDALFNIGMLLLDERRADDALIYLEQAVRLAPNHPEAHNNLGLVLADLGRFDEALASCDTSLRFRPLDAKTHMNRGNVFSGLGRMGEAIASYDYALRLKPDYVNAVWNRSLSFLALGDFVRGFAEYESRWQKPETKNRSLPEPRWDGSPLDGKTILLWCEQGMGDMIQFIRYAFELKNRGASVWVECPEPLVSLLVKCPAVDRIIAEGTPLPAGFDCHAPVMSLPSLCRTSLATVPVHVPYLVADPGEVDRWRNELGATLGLKIGITWQGNPRHRHDRHRSFSVQRFRHVAQLDGVTVYSLQKGTGIEQLQAVGFPITDLRGPLDTAGGAFCNTAAAIGVLDLVITCDSAVAHLAGALGKPVWMPLSDLSDWRWLREREDSPWYPTMRIFRQPTLGDWATVFERILDAVRDLRDQNPQLAVHRTIPASDKVVDWPGLLEFRAQARAAGKTVV
jgi:tetratricopeptide (TPR) repeat protein